MDARFYPVKQPVPKHQADATLAQAAPVQNTWYTVLNTTVNARIMGIAIQVLTTDETLEVRVTIDGQALTGSIAATAGTWYYASISIYAGTLGIGGVGNRLSSAIYEFEGRSVKIEARKTTATGAGTLNARVVYAKW